MASSATSNNNPNSSSSSSISPRHTPENRGSPTQSRRPSRSSPWTQIVRGGESVPTLSSPAAVAAPSSPQSKPIAASPPLPASSSSSPGEEKKSEGNAGKKPVWKRPSNGGADAATSEVGGPVVMGASSWPALSEATTNNNKSSSDSLKSLVGGDVVAPSVPVSQGIANASVPATKPVGRANANPTPNHSRQRSFKKNGASGSSANGTASQPSAQGGSLAESPSHNPSPRGQNQRNGFPSQTHGGGNDNVSQRDSYRNQNGNNHHQSHGGRRNQEQHGNQNWNFNRSFNGRDGNVHSQRGAPAFVRHPPPPPLQQPIPPQFMAAAQPVPPFAGPLPFPPELASQYYQRMPFVAPLSPGPVFYHVQDPPLNIKLQKQIQYYFSEENLIKDTYLRRQMDDQGFVALPVIANFKKVAELTDSIQQIADALQGSPVVEVQGDRIRKRFNWQHWLLPQDPNPQSVGAVASRVGNLALGESSAGPNGGSSSHQLQSAGAENEAVSDALEQSLDGANR